jgi:hypothetical protein
MPAAYVNTAPTQLLGTHPRAVYRITVERAGLSALSFATGSLKWADVVEQTVSAVGRSPFGVPLGYPRPADSDAVAVFEVRAPTAPSSGDSVGDLVRVTDDATSFSRVARIERLPPVPGASDTQATADRATTRDAEATRAAADAASRSPFERLATFGGRLAWPVGIALAIVGLVLLAPYIPRKR